MQLNQKIFRLLKTVLPVSLSGTAAGIALWDWFYPLQFPQLLAGNAIFTFYSGRLILFAGGGAVAAWALLWLVRVSTGKPASVWSFAPLFFMLLAPVRYGRHPLGMTWGSSLWAYGLIIPLAITLAGGFAPLLTRIGASSQRKYPVRLVWLLMAVYIAAFGMFVGLRYTAFRSHGLDLGTMSQTAWNTAQGHFFEYTPLIEQNTTAAVPISNRLISGKLEVVFVLLALVYRLLPNPILLLVLQTIVLAFSALPLFLLLADIGRNNTAALAATIMPETIALVLTTAYLLYLPLHYVNLADFHSNALMPLPVAWAIYAVAGAKKRRWLYAPALLGMVICRIDAVLVIAGLGVLLVWQKQYQAALLSFALAAGWMLLDFGLVLPWAEARYGPDPVGLIDQRFGQWGNGPVAIARGMISHPQTLPAMLVSREKLQTGFDLLMPLGGLPLVSPWWLIPAVPVIFMNLIANSGWQNSIQAHYFAPVLPFLFAATGFAVYHPITRKLGPIWPAGLSLYVLFSTLMITVLFSPMPAQYQLEWFAARRQSNHQQAISRVMAQVSTTESLSVQSDLLPHLAHRRELYLFPVGSASAYEILLDLDNAAERAPLDYFAYQQQVISLLNNSDYGPVVWDDGILLLRRGESFASAQALATYQVYMDDFYRVSWLTHTTPAQMLPQQLYPVEVCFQNTSRHGWSPANWFPVFVAYHWLTDTGDMVVWEGEQFRLKHSLYPGQQLCQTVLVVSPDAAGAYQLQFDLLRYKTAWFSEQGATPLTVRVMVK